MKNLANLLGRTARSMAVVSSMAVPLVFAGCHEENYPPEAGLDVSPIYGEAPLSVRMKVTGTDANGNDDIKQYKLNINKEVINSNTPIDITRTLDTPGIYNIYGEVVDSENASDKTEVSSVEVKGRPFIEQYAGLSNNGIDIDYSATLSYVDKAQLEVKREGVLLSTEEVKDVNPSGPDYNKTFNYAVDGITKGNYEFVLKSYNLESKNSVVVPNYPSSINTNGISFNLNENSESNVTLPNPSDKNPEDNPVTIKSVKSLDGKTWVTLNGNALNIKAPYTYFGPYQLEFELKNTGGLEKVVVQGNIIEDKRINPFVQPNDTTLNWYGSGDVNNDNIVNGQDLTRLNELITRTYSNPSDKRLKDRADVNGDEVVNNQDKQILEGKLNGSIPYLPGEWNKLITRVEREDWLKKMLKIDKTNITAFPRGDCVQYSNLAYINFHGVSLTDVPKFLEVYPYDFTNNGRFNLPLCDASIQYYDLDGKLTGEGHAMNTIVLGNNALSWNDLCNVEPQNDAINVQPGEAYFSGTNSEFLIRGSPVMSYYIKYVIKNNIPTFIKTNPDIKIITQRGK